MTVEQWLGENNQLSIDIWQKKYRNNNEDFEQWLERVSGGNTDVKKLIKEKKFLFGGRTLANRGTDNNASFFNCFTSGNKVITKRGLVNIEDVVIGDEVVAEDNKWHKVNDIMCRNYDGDLYKISSNWFINDIVCTPNHMFLTNNGWKRADRIEALPMRITRPDRLKVPDILFQKQYDDIDLCSYMHLSQNQKYEELNDGKIQIVTSFLSGRNSSKTVNNRRQNPFKRYLKLDSDMLYFIGRWIGDGSVTLKHGVNSENSIASVLQIVFNASKEKDAAERIIKIGEEHFGISPNVRTTNQNCISVRWNSETLCNFFYEEFGRHCDGKHIPNKYIGDINIACGLMDSDGCISTHGSMRLVLKNKGLVEWMQETLILNGMLPGAIHQVKKQVDTYMLQISSGIGKGKLGKLLMKQYYDKKNNLDNLPSYYKDFSPITNIEVIENQHTKVYNISVEDVHSYTINGIIVHNCYSRGFVEDDYKDIMQACVDIGLTFKAQGGQGISLTKLRPKASPVGKEYTSDGIIPFMKIYNEVTSGTSQGGSRKGALMLSIDARHKEAETFIKIKSKDEMIEKANLSLEIDNDFMSAVKEYYSTGKVITLHEKRNYSGHLIEYDVIPISVFKSLVDNSYDWGDPACLFVDRFRNYNLMEFDEDYNIETCNPLAI